MLKRIGYKGQLLATQPIMCELIQYAISDNIFLTYLTTCRYNPTEVQWACPRYLYTGVHPTTQTTGTHFILFNTNSGMYVVHTYTLETLNLSCYVTVMSTNPLHSTITCSVAHILHVFAYLYARQHLNLHHSAMKLTHFHLLWIHSWCHNALHAGPCITGVAAHYFMYSSCHMIDGPGMPHMGTQTGTRH